MIPQDNTDFIKEITDRIDLATKGIASYLASHVKDDGNFPTPTYYGEAYASRLWAEFPNEFNMLTNNTLDAIDMWQNDQGITNKDGFVWEFVVHALWDIRGQYKKVDKIIGKWVPSNPSVTNYRLMRYLAAVRTRRQGKLNSSLKAIWTTWHPPSSFLEYPEELSGFIKDKHEDYSIQYHCFSASLLYQIWQETKSNRVLKRFLSAVAMTEELVMPNGDICFLGRGQHQIFGHVSAIMSFAYAFSVTSESKFLVILNTLLNRLLSFQKLDGSIPLVMNSEESGYPLERVDINQPKYFGWFIYNDLFDYLPFCGAMLCQVSKTLNAGSINDYSASIVIKKSPHFRIIDKKKYKAVVSRPYGNQYNNLSLPYLCVDGKSVTPSFGGEQYTRSIYIPDALPTPILKSDTGTNIYVSESCSYKWDGETLIGTSNDFRHVRKFQFFDSGYNFRDELEFSSKCSIDLNEYQLQWNYLFFLVEGHGKRFRIMDKYGGYWGDLKSSMNLEIERNSLYNANGNIEALVHRTHIKKEKNFIEIDIRFINQTKSCDRG